MIRQANKFDLDDIIRLIQEFAFESPMAQGYDPLKWSKTYVLACISGVLAGKGIILIDDKKSALLIAVFNPVFWIQDEWQLVEVLLHSKNKVTMIKMVKEFCKIADEYKQKGLISKAIIGSHKKVNYEKLGFKHIESLWEF